MLCNNLEHYFIFSKQATWTSKAKKIEKKITNIQMFVVFFNPSIIFSNYYFILILVSWILKKCVICFSFTSNKFHVSILFFCANFFNFLISTAIINWLECKAVVLKFEYFFKNIYEYFRLFLNLLNTINYSYII